MTTDSSLTIHHSHRLGRDKLKRRQRCIGQIWQRITTMAKQCNTWIFHTNETCWTQRLKTVRHFASVKTRFGFFQISQSNARLKRLRIDGEAIFFQRIVVTVPVESHWIRRLNLTFEENGRSSIFREIFQCFHPKHRCWSKEMRRVITKSKIKDTVLNRMLEAMWNSSAYLYISYSISLDTINLQLMRWT